MFTITHEQNITCRKRNLHDKMHHPTNIFGQLHVLYLLVMQVKRKTKIHRIIIESQLLNWQVMCHVGLIYSQSTAQSFFVHTGSHW